MPMTEKVRTSMKLRRILIITERGRILMATKLRSDMMVPGLINFRKCFSRRKTRKTSMTQKQK